MRGGGSCRKGIVTMPLNSLIISNDLDCQNKRMKKELNEQKSEHGSGWSEIRSKVNARFGEFSKLPFSVLK